MVRRTKLSFARVTGFFIGLRTFILAEAYFLFVLAIRTEDSAARCAEEHTFPQYARPLLLASDRALPTSVNVFPHWLQAPTHCFGFLSIHGG